MLNYKPITHNAVKIMPEESKQTSPKGTKSEGAGAGASDAKESQKSEETQVETKVKTEGTDQKSVETEVKASE